jgi:uncharacterized protein with FMN-binding domain
VRKTTTAIVGLASAGAIWASWTAGLTSEHRSSGVSIVSAPRVKSPGASSPAKRPPAAGTGPAAHSAQRSGPTSPPRAQTVDGAVVGTPYGDVQVQLTHLGSKITDVHALRLTDSSQHSVSISAYAAPILRDEAIAAQSSQIDVVSGATYTSEGYQTSLQAAIDAAHL